MFERVKALIPAAGQGRRLASISGGGAKELLGVGSLTMIEHCLAMVLDSGVTEVGLVIRPDKQAVGDRARQFWTAQGRAASELTFFYQEVPLGVADAMRLAADYAGDDPLAVIMPDHFLVGEAPALGQMLSGFRQSGQCTMGVIPMPSDRAPLFGNVGRVELEQDSAGGPPLVKSFTPKLAGQLPRLGVGQYKGLIGVIYVPGWASMIDGLAPNPEGEIDDTDLVLNLVQSGQLRAVILDGLGFDLGNVKGLEAARMALAGGRSHAP